MSIHPDQKLMRVPTAVEIVTGIRPSPAKCWRWYTQGIKGVRLQTWLVGGSRLTSIVAVREFIEARTNPQPQPAPQSKPRKLSNNVREFLIRELGL